MSKVHRSTLRPVLVGGAEPTGLQILMVSEILILTEWTWLNLGMAIVIGLLSYGFMVYLARRDPRYIEKYLLELRDPAEYSARSER
jgi:type IV secretory pathway TrbD component